MTPHETMQKALTGLTEELQHQVIGTLVRGGCPKKHVDAVFAVFGKTPPKDTEFKLSPIRRRPERSRNRYFALTIPFNPEVEYSLVTADQGEVKDELLWLVERTTPLSFPELRKAMQEAALIGGVTRIPELLPHLIFHPLVNVVKEEVSYADLKGVDKRLYVEYYRDGERSWEHGVARFFIQ